MHRLVLAAASLAVGLGAGPLFLQANYDIEAPEGRVVSRTITEPEVDQVLMSQKPDLTLSLNVPNLSPFDAMDSDLVQKAPVQHTVFFPFLAEGAAVDSDAEAVLVDDADDLEAKYNKGLRKFAMNTHCLKQAQLASEKLEELGERDNHRTLTVLSEAEETARFRRRLLSSVEPDILSASYGYDEMGQELYKLNMTPNMLAGLLIGLFLITVAYCGFTIMLDIEVPLRTREKHLPLRKEF